MFDCVCFVMYTLFYNASGGDKDFVMILDLIHGDQIGLFVFKSVISSVPEGTVCGQVLCDVCLLVAGRFLGHLCHSIDAGVVWEGEQRRVGCGRRYRCKKRRGGTCSRLLDS